MASISWMFLAGGTSVEIGDEIVVGTVTEFGPCVNLDGRLIVVWPPGTVWDEDEFAAVLPGGRQVPLAASVVGHGRIVSRQAAIELDPTLDEPLRRCIPPEPGPADDVVFFDPTSITPPTRVGTAVGLVGPAVVGGPTPADLGPWVEVAGTVTQRAGGCLLLSDDAVLVWPLDSRWQDRDGELWLADGRRVAADDRITLRATIAQLDADGRPPRQQAAINVCAGSGRIDRVVTIDEVVAITPP